MANKHRGEVEIRVNDAPRPIVLNLGTLAALEAEFKVDRFEDVFAMLNDRKASTMLAILTCIVVGNGVDGQEAAKAVASLSVGKAMRLVNDLFEVSGITGSDQSDDEPGDSGPLARASAGGSG